jgi:arabinosaccharide transport system substrate-binding protein
MIEKFPYGKAPFWLCVVALLSTLTLLITEHERPPRPDLVLAVFMPSHLDSYRQTISEFEKENGIRIGTQLVTWGSLEARLQSSLLAGTDVPDLTEISEGTMGFFTRGPDEDIGFLDLTDRLEEDGLRARIVESRFSLWSARGHVYGLPHDVHPVMLAYRRDLVEALGIDVQELSTWEDFVRVGRRITRDIDGNGVMDRYMLDLSIHGGAALQMLILQRGAGLFDAHGNVTFNTEVVADTIYWYVHQTLGKDAIAYDCGWGQPLMKAMLDGLALFYFAPDWRTYNFQKEVPSLRGKMALMPLPAWQKGGRRTTVWGGTGLTISRSSKNPELAWKLAKRLYFAKGELGARFAATNIIPPLKEAWNLPEFNQPSEYFSGQPLGKLYAELAPDTPPFYSSPVHKVATAKLDEAYGRAVEHYKAHGDQGLREAIARELDSAEAYVKRMAQRSQALAQRHPTQEL